MCGIGGILHFDNRPVDPARLAAMADAMACRGPDAQHVRLAGPCGLVHTRLAVIDPPGGAQPMERDGVMVSFNGEIYNHIALRRELLQAAIAFDSDHSDTEVLLHALRRWGMQALPRLDGMFAFAAWLPATRELLLVRDRTGKKPLYFNLTHEGLTFASTPAGLMPGLSHRPGIDHWSLGQYLRYAQVPQSLLAGVQELPPGYMMRCRTDGSHFQQRWWHPPKLNADHDPSKVTRTLYEAIRGGVRRRIEADVPLGCFLSGGIDSSLVAALAHKLLKDRDQRLKTFSVAMPVAPQYDESAHAAAVAKHLGTDHRELIAGGNFETDLQHLIATMGEPLADSSLLPSYWLSRAAREQVTVALSGDGGDELFGGYERYVAMRLLRGGRWWLRHLPLGPPRGNPKSRRHRLARLVTAAKAGGPNEAFTSIVQLFDASQLAQLGVEPPPGLHLDPFDDPADAARHWDFENYLPFDLLRKVDRASMAVGLEVRCPLLDTAVVEAALATPMRTLMPARRTKSLLRDMASMHLPPSIIERPKMGFAIPIGRWFANELRPMLRGWLLDCPALVDLGMKRSALDRLIDEHKLGKYDHAQRLFALLSLAMWADQFLQPSDKQS